MAAPTLSSITLPLIVVLLVLALRFAWHWQPWTIRFDRTDWRFIGAISVFYAVILWDFQLQPDQSLDFALGVRRWAGFPADVGIRSSADLFQSTMWSRIVAMFLSTGAQVALLAPALMLLGVASTTALWRTVRRSGAHPTTLAYGIGLTVLLLARFEVLGRLQHDILLWPSSIAIALALHRFRTTPEFGHALLVGLALALGIGSHIAVIAFVPFPLIMIGAATQRHRLYETLGMACGMIGITAWVFANTSVSVLTQFVPEGRFLQAITICGAIGCVLGGRYAPFTVRRTLLISIGGFFACVFTGILLMGYEFSARYVVVGIPTLMLLVRWPELSERARRRMVVLLTILAMAGLFRAAKYHRPLSTWRLSDVTRLTPVLAAHGNLMSLGESLQSADRRALLLFAANQLGARPSNGDGEILQIVRISDRTTTPNDWSRVPLRGSVDAIYRTIRPTVPLRDAQICTDADCVVIGQQAEGGLGGPNLVFDPRSVLLLDVPANTTLVGLPSERSTRGPCYPSFTLEGTEPADFVTVTTPSRVTFTLPEACWSVDASPAWIELKPDESAVREAIEAQRLATRYGWDSRRPRTPSE